MADIYGCHFEYAGKSSRKDCAETTSLGLSSYGVASFGLVMVSMNAARFIKLNGDTNSITVFNKKANKRVLINDDYSSSPLSFDVEIMTDTQCIIPKSDRSLIEKWLFNRSSYRELYFDKAEDTDEEMFEIIDGSIKRNYLNCRFVNPEKIECGCGIVGYKATLEADSNMLWQDAITKTFSLTGSSSIITVPVNSDIDDYIYPKVTITAGSTGGTVTIFNNTDDNTRLTRFLSVPSHASIIMKGEINYVSGNYYERFDKKNFIRLLDGNNSISITGDVASIVFEFSNRRMF